ncbi:four helix bundle protein [bacterium]|nr:four helix bundle protein [bacterium]
MIQGFLTYDLAVALYDQCESVQAKHYIKDQLVRASLSIVLNIAEGSGKPTQADRRRFYAIALGSNREVQALLAILKQSTLLKQADRLGGMLYRLVHPK